MTSTTPKTKKIVLDCSKDKTKVVTFRAHEETADQVKELAKKIGLSTCHIYDGLGKAFVHGTSFILTQENQKNHKTLCIQLPWICNTINVSVFREVGKVRRHKYNELPERQANPYLNFDIPYGETAQDPRSYD